MKKNKKRQLILVIVAVAMLIIGGGYQLFATNNPIISGDFDVVYKGLESGNLKMNLVEGTDTNLDYEMKYDGKEKVCNLGYNYYYVNIDTDKVNDPIMHSTPIDGYKSLTRYFNVQQQLNDSTLFWGIEIKLYGCDENNKATNEIIEEYTNVGELMKGDVSDEQTFYNMPVINVTKIDDKSNEYVKYSIDWLANNGIASVAGELYDVSTGTFKPVTAYDSELNESINMINQDNSEEHSGGYYLETTIERTSVPKVFKLRLTDVNGNKTEKMFLVQALNHSGPYCFTDEKNITIEKGDYEDLILTCMSEVGIDLDSSTSFANSIPEGEFARVISNNSNVGVKKNRLNGNEFGGYNGTIYLDTIRITGNIVGNSILTVSDVSIRDNNKDFLSNDYGDYTMSLVNVNVTETVLPKVTLINDTNKYNYTKNTTIPLTASIISSDIEDISRDDFNIYLDGKLDNDAANIEIIFGAIVEEPGLGCYTMFSVNVIPLKVGKIKISVKENAIKNIETNQGNKESNSFEFVISEPKLPIAILENKMDKTVYNTSDKIYIYLKTFDGSTPNELVKDNFNILLDGKSDQDAVEFSKEFAGEVSDEGIIYGLYEITLVPQKAGKLEISLKPGIVKMHGGTITAKESNKLEYTINNPNVKDPVCNIKFTNSQVEFNSPVYIHVECTTDDSIFNEDKYLQENFLKNIKFSNNEVVSLITFEKIIFSSNKYVIDLKGFATKAGTTVVTLNENSFVEKNGHGNKSVTSNVITVMPKKVDTTGPKCTFDFDNTKIKIGKTTTGYLICTDASGLKDSDISASDIKISGLFKKISIQNITKLNNMNDISYKWKITVKGRLLGSSSLTLRDGAITDMKGNLNSSITSDSIRVSLFK